MGLLDGGLGDAMGDAMGGLMKNAGGANTQDMLGGLLGQLTGGQRGASNGALAAVMALVQQNGGVEGIIAKFRSGGLQDVVASWVGTGTNAPISATQVQQVLGDASVNDVAASMGVEPAQASSSLATMLPALINQLTPNGAVDSGSNDMLSQGLSMLRSQLGK